jgi:hypothetical protein
MTFIATPVLLLAAATLVVIGGALFTPFLVGLFVLALFGVLARHGDRTVRPHEPPPDPSRWRGCA